MGQLRGERCICSTVVSPIQGFWTTQSSVPENTKNTVKRAHTMALLCEQQSSCPSDPILDEEQLREDSNKVELGQELAAEFSRQDSCLSAGSIPEDEEEDVCSDGGLEHSSEASEEGGPDSGIEAEKEADMVVPDQDLTDRIVTQVEIYFSDSNVMKDKFLLKHIRRNKEGFVSLKLVSSFKKVKQLTKDWRVVAHALSKSSNGIEINDLGTKIRRVAPLPEIDDAPVTCTVLALNLPLERPSIDTVSQLFGECGDIALIRVLRAGAPLSAEMKHLATKYPTLNTTNCAWVEFEVPEAAKEACKLFSEEEMQVVPIATESGKKKQVGQKSQPNSRKNSTNSQQGSRKNSFNNYQYQGQQLQQFRGPNPRKHSFKNNNNNYINHPRTQHDFLNSFNPRHPAQRRKAISLNHMERPNLRDLTVIAEGGDIAGGTRRRPKSKSCFEFPGQGFPGSESWVQRHLLAAALASAASTAPSPIITKAAPRPSRTSVGSLNLPDGVMRFPKGPDGSRGFGVRRESLTMERSI